MSKPASLRAARRHRRRWERYLARQERLTGQAVPRHWYRGHQRAVWDAVTILAYRSTRSRT